MTYKEFEDLEIGSIVYEKSTGNKFKVLTKHFTPTFKRGYKHGTLCVESMDEEVSIRSYRSFKLNRR